MGWIEDSVEEFRKLPPAGKIAVGGAVVGVVILAYASYRAHGGSASADGATVTGAFPGGIGVPTATDSAGGAWTFPPTVQSSTGASGVFLGSLGLPSRSVNPPTTASDLGARAPVTRAAPNAPSFVQTAAAHVASSARAPLPESPRQAAFIPTTIRPRPTPGRGRAI